MYSKSQLASKWFQYYIRASSGRGHGVHSPFVFELIREVFNDDRDYYAYKLIETVKKTLLQDDRILQVKDPGAGSGIKKEHSKKKISDIAGTVVSDQKFGRLLFRLANFYRAGTIIELGTSLGISASYLASADTGSRIITIEGSPPIAGIAKETFEKLKLNNISQVIGNFEDRLPDLIATNPPADLVFIDGNHRKKPVMEYFEQFMNRISPSSVIIIHDIHWSREMEEAWELIQKHPGVKMSIDIFSAGLVFFRTEFRVKQHFTIRF
jgi:predicted O-methyltransferase YrrM